MREVRQIKKVGGIRVGLFKKQDLIQVNKVILLFFRVKWTWNKLKIFRTIPLVNNLEFERKRALLVRCEVSASCVTNGHLYTEKAVCGNSAVVARNGTQHGIRLWKAWCSRNRKTEKTVTSEYGRWHGATEHHGEFEFVIVPVRNWETVK